MVKIEQVTSYEKQRVARKTSLISIAVNLVLTMVQILTGVVAHSSGLLADGIHSLSDVGADVVVLFANRFSHKAADDNHPYGHSRFENAASLVLGLILLAVGVGMLWSAAMKFRAPELIVSVHMAALWVALAALFAKEALFRYMLALAKHVKSSLLVANAWHARSDAASSLVVACGIVGNLMGLPFLDPLAAAIVGFMIGKLGWTFSYEALQDLVDRGLGEKDVSTIKEVLAKTQGVLNVHDIRTRKMGDLGIVDAHLLVDRYISVSEGHQLALQARQRVLERLRVADVTIHIDADLADERANLGLLPRQDLLLQLNSRFPNRPFVLEQLRAHYLDGRLELDIFLPVNDIDRVLQLRAMPPLQGVSQLRVYQHLF